MGTVLTVSVLIFCINIFSNIEKSLAINYNCENIIPVYTKQSTSPTNINYIISDQNAQQSSISNVSDFIAQNSIQIDKIKAVSALENTKLTDIICLQKIRGIVILTEPTELAAIPTPISDIVAAIVAIFTSPKLVGSGAENIGTVAANMPLTAPRSFLNSEHLDWKTLCANAVNKTLPTSLGINKDYLRSGTAGIEVYPLDVPDDATYDRAFYAIGLSTSDRTSVYSFISDTPCAGTATNVYTYAGGLGGTQGTVSSMSYSNSDYEVKVSPGRWYITLLWGSDQYRGPSVYARFDQHLSR